MWIVGRAYHVDVGLFNQPDISLHRPAVDKESHTGMEVVTVHSFQLDGFPVDFEDVSRDFYFPQNGIDALLVHTGVPQRLLGVLEVLLGELLEVIVVSR